MSMMILLHHVSEPQSPVLLFQDLVMQRLLFKAASDTAWDVLHSLRANPPLCWTVGLPVNQSRLLHGLVLHGHLSSPLMADMLEKWVTLWLTC
jgi:hypothetical protein